MNNFRCECPAGYLGRTCQNVTNECSTHPCKNGGTCQDLHLDYIVRIFFKLHFVSFNAKLGTIKEKESPGHRRKMFIVCLNSCSKLKTKHLHVYIFDYKGLYNFLLS